MNAQKRILIVCQLDRFANGLKALEIQRFLQKRGHVVQVYDTDYLSRISTSSAYSLLAIRAAGSLLTRRWQFGRRCFSYHMVLADYRLRRAILRSSLPLDDFDLIICETPHDAGVLEVESSARTLYDCPTPWADELWYEGRLTKRQYRKLRRRETALFEGVDHLAFHWESYARYAIEHYRISGRNLLTLNFGCNPAEKRAEYNSAPRVVYLGSLGSRFIDLPLLARLTAMYPHIDVYGGPPPDPRLGLNYLGYGVPSVLQQYQLGLVTCTKDELRREGFSAKHLEYLAHGLPVLVPSWRRHLNLLRGSVQYDEDNFTSVVAAFKSEEEWRRVSEEAYQQAKRLAWGETLRPLETLLGQL